MVLFQKGVSKAKSDLREDTMKSTITMAQLQAQCQAQAKKKYSAIHFLKRRAFVKSCMHQKA